MFAVSHHENENALFFDNLSLVVHLPVYQNKSSIFDICVIFNRWFTIIRKSYDSNWANRGRSLTVKVLLFIGTNFRGFYKMHWSLGSWIRDFKHYRQQSMGKLYFVRFLYSWFKWNKKSAKIRTPRKIMISQY